MARFVVLAQKRSRSGYEPGTWILRPLSVDDDGFRTTWRLTLATTDGQIEIGSIKILKSGQRAGRTPLDAEFDELGPAYASLGAEIDFYIRLRDAAPASVRTVLKALGDIATDVERRRRFENEPGFAASLVRFSPAKAALEEAGSLLDDAAPGPAPASAPDQDLIFHTTAGGAPFTISFDLDASAEIPSRISVVIGPNGSGKTRLLANLALVAFDPDSAEGAAQWGRLETPIAFSRVLAFSYSAFDEFDVPAQTKAEREAFVRGRSGLGYRYFGLRDLTSQPTSPRESAGLKTARQIRDEFHSACRAALDEPDDLLTVTVDRLFREPSFAATGSLSGGADAAGLQQLLFDTFRRASTGHKFVLLMTMQLAAWLRRDTLVLIDEPESHLHPPLLASFLMILRHMLGAREAHAIIATHSPFIVQETPARYVRIISRHANRTSIAPPSSETYGEDIGTISREVFRLNSRTGEFTEVLRDLAARYSLDEIEARFQNGLSGQARALVMAAQARRRS
jgi:predicted ATPase